MAGQLGEDERRSARIRHWLLAILQFAVTRDDTDHMRILEAARELDRPVSGILNLSFSYFMRTSVEICSAIVTNKGDRRIVLTRHFNSIEDRRLRDALLVATGLKIAASADQAPPRLRRDYLWRGLSPRQRI